MPQHIVKARVIYRVIMKTRYSYRGLVWTRSLLGLTVFENRMMTTFRLEREREREQRDLQKQRRNMRNAVSDYLYCLSIVQRRNQRE